MADLIDRQAVLNYIERLNNSGLGKGKSLEYLKKYVEHLKWICPDTEEQRWKEKKDE